MSKLTQESNIDRLSEPKEAFRFIAIFFNQLVSILNGGLKYSDNFDGKIITVDFSGATSSQAVSHSLGRVPVGYTVQRLSAPIVIYDGSGTNTSSSLYLGSSGAGRATLMVF